MGDNMATTMATNSLLRSRTKSDVMSGTALNKAEWPRYTEEDVMRHFSLFNQYDLDHTGFISKENLLDVLNAMEVKGASLSMATSILDEVAILCGHDNDGKLSFRDYMHAIEYDHSAAAQNTCGELDAQTGEHIEADLCEIERDVDHEPVGAEPEQAQGGRARHSSLSIVNALATARITAFQQAVDQARSRDKKIDAFKVKPELLGAPIVNSEEVQKETLTNKIKAFEVAARYKGKVELKKTWRQTHGTGNYLAAQRIMIGDTPAKPPPKKRLADLP